MSITRYLVTGALCVALAPMVANAGSMGLTDFGSRSSGRGSAMTAVTDDPAAIYYNPANIAVLPGFSFDVGIGVVMPRFSYTPSGGGSTTTSRRTAATPPFLSAAYNLGAVNVAGVDLGDIAFGFGMYVPLGSGLEWPENWAGRQQVRKISLQVFEFNPVVAWRLGEKIAVGGGFRYLRSSVFESRAVSFGDAVPEGSVRLGGTGYGLGYNLGVGIYATDAISLGLSYRSGPTLKMEGRADFDFPEPFDTQAKDAKVKTNIDTADFITGGIAVKPLSGDRLTLSFDVEWQGWSRYKSLTVEFPNGEMPSTVSPRNSKDTVALHFGVNFKATESFTVRGGYSHDQLTVPEQYVDPAPPDSNVHVLALGASYVFGDVGAAQDLGVNVYFENCFFEKRTAVTSSFPGTWQGGYPLGTEAYLFGIGLSGHFDTGTSSHWSKVPAPLAQNITSNAPAQE